MRCNVLIGGTDKGYIHAFVDFLTKSKNNQFNLTVLMEIDPCLRAIAFDQFDLYLFEEDFYLKLEEGLPSISLPKILVLSEAMTAVDTLVVKTMLKYQNIKAIEEEIIAFYLASTNNEVVSASHKSPKLVTFYGPSGGAGTTTVAQIFAQQKKAKGYKVLFVSLEDLPSYHQMYTSLNPANMSDYLVHLLSKTNWLVGLERMLSVDEATGVHYINPANNGMDMADVDPALWERWLTYMIEMSDYDYLVIDLGSHLFQGGVELLSLSKHCVYMLRDDKASALKWQGFQKQMEQLTGQEALQDKTVFCRQLGMGETAIMENVDALLPFDPSLMKCGKEGHHHLNPQSEVYQRIGEFLNHV